MFINFSKKILAVVAVLFIIQLLFFNLVLAEENNGVKFTPQVGIPGTEFQKGAEIPIPDTTAKIGEYIKGFYIFIISALAILSVVMIAWAGITWLTAGGSAEKVGAAKAHILSALGGLALGLLSYVILQTINPDLVSFKTSTIEMIKAQYCCEESNTCNYKSKEECKGELKEGYICGFNGKCITEAGIRTCDNTAGKCKNPPCSANEEAWSSYGCPTAGQICCLPKGIASELKCGNVPGVNTICRNNTGEIGSGCFVAAGETPFLANCDSGKVCCAIGAEGTSLKSCGADNKGICFNKWTNYWYVPCALTLCPSGYKGYSESGGNSCSFYQCCCTIK